MNVPFFIDDASIVLDGVDFKFDPFLTVLDEGLDSVGLDGGSLCTRIYPCLDRGHPQFLEPAPFDATYDVHVSEFEKKSRKSSLFNHLFCALVGLSIRILDGVFPAAALAHRTWGGEHVAVHGAFQTAWLCWIIDGRSATAFVPIRRRKS